MEHYVANPPDAGALMTSARSFGNYDLAGAIADLIDNSIKAKAKKISLTCLFKNGEPEIRILDDGSGMSQKELHAAMRPASTNPLERRALDDLGRFGWGLKSASFSQCRRLTVLTRQDDVLSGAVWNLCDIKDWKMGVLSPDEAREICSPEFVRDGTEVIWSDCDRLSEDGSLNSDDFNGLIFHARERLALIFHRFLSGDAPRRRLEIALNGTPIPRTDPFFREHNATQVMEEETFPAGNGATIRIRPYILPHYSKLNSSELEGIAGDEGLLRNQGFYVYRNNRLILYGTWFRLVQHGELSQLVRVSIDVPNSLDSVWKLTLDKSDAQLPTVLRGRLRQLVAKLKGRSSRVYRAKGGQLRPAGPATIWQRFARHGEIRYGINREHPLIEAMFLEHESDRIKAISAALSAIEQGLPVISFGADVSRDADKLNQSITNPHAFHDFLNAALPPLLVQVEGDMKALTRLLKTTEPFSANWTAVEHYLLSEGWLSV